MSNKGRAFRKGREEQAVREQVINENISVAQALDIVAAEMDGETLMMSIQNGMYYGLDEVGSRIWELISEPRRVSHLIDRLMEEYEVGRVPCQADTLDLLNQLYKEGLIRIA